MPVKESTSKRFCEVVSHANGCINSLKSDEAMFDPFTECKIL